MDPVLQEFVDDYRGRGVPPPHILLVGKDDEQNASIAREFARKLGTEVVAIDSSNIGLQGDFTGFLTAGKALFLSNVQHLKRQFTDRLSDDDLIDFVRDFGPVVSKSWKLLPFVPPPGPWRADDPSVQILMRVRQDLQELRSERRIYKAAFGLLVELDKKPIEFDVDCAKQQMAEIARDIRGWPRQWNREKKERGENPLWRVRGDSIRRIAALAKSGPDLLLPPQLDARIVICELVNVFPSLAFPNPPEMHSYIRFGIRPLLYSILRREFFQTRDVGVCANTQCRAFFEVERAGQRFCDDECSRSQRQRDYWKNRGKRVRKKRLA
ncbi:MAG: hypothetical protein WCF30_19235, partial [Terracidiphilus sp.]